MKGIPLVWGQALVTTSAQGPALALGFSSPEKPGAHEPLEELP